MAPSCASTQQCLKLPARPVVLTQLLARSPISGTAKRSRQTISALAGQYLLSPTDHLARHLITVASAHGPQGRQQDVFEVDLSQSGLAQTLGISRQSLNQSMKQLEKQVQIEQKYSKVSIKSISPLEQLVKETLYGQRNGLHKVAKNAK